MKVIHFPQNACPCSQQGADRQVTRLELPVAPQAQVRLRAAPSTKARPAMLPTEALAWLDGALLQGVRPETVELAGPGDPLATPGPTYETLQLIRQQYPNMPLSLRTHGLGGKEQAESLAELGVGRVTLEVEAATPEVAQELYAWIRPGTKTLPLAKAAPLLIEEQAAAVRAFSRAGIEVVIATTVFPGINDDQIEHIARTMAELGAASMTLNPFQPAADTEGTIEAPEQQLMAAVRQQAATHLQTFARCGPGNDGEKILNPHHATGEGMGSTPKPSRQRPNLAVASTNGMEVDLHLGQAIQLLIYGPREDGLACLLETRPAPEPGGGSSRWETLAESLGDCFALLAASAGESPRRILGSRGIPVLVTEGDIEGTVDLLYGGGKKGKKRTG